MDLLSAIVGFAAGFFIGAGIVLGYVSYSFSRSVKNFEEEMDSLNKLVGEEKKLEE